MTSIALLTVPLLAITLFAIGARFGRRNHDGHDTLTGLPDRATLDGTIDAALGTTGFALIRLDVDDFRLVIESFGHSTGDLVVRILGARLAAAMPDEALLAHEGEDRFVALVPAREEDAAARARRTAEALLRAVQEPFRIAGREFGLTASIGIGVFPQHGSTRDEVLGAAHAATQQAKHAWRGGYAFYSASTHDALRRLELTTRLRRAVERGELTVDFQPIVRLATGEVEAVEVLVRWPGADVPPSVFVPLAEETGLIDRLGERVVDAACRQAVAWRAEGIAPRIAINVSPLQLRRPGFTQSLRDRIARHGLEASSFTVELTESAFTDSRRLPGIVLALRAAGFRVALDDFGADYSTFARLRDCPVDELKIDRSFLEGVPDDGWRTQVLDGLLSLARSLGAEVVAEGIEGRDQRAHLAERGCDLGQGFYFARPQSGPVATELLRRMPAWAGGGR